MEQLIACNLLAWCLQPNPKDRPQSCTEILAHSFFAAMKEVSAAEVEEEKSAGAAGGTEAQVSEAQVLELSKGLKLTTRVHIAAELGEQGIRLQPHPPHPPLPDTTTSNPTHPPPIPRTPHHSFRRAALPEHARR